MNNKKKIYLLCFAFLLTACDKKEILQGKREDLFVDAHASHSMAANQEIAALPVSLGQSLSLQSWDDTGANNKHSSVNHKMNLQPRVCWKKSIGNGPIHSSPVAFDGKIYAIDANGILHCVSQNEGKILWRKSVAKQPSESVFSGGLAAHDGVIYITTNIGLVLAIDSRTKKALWENNVKALLKGPPVFVADRIIVTTADNQTLALDAKKGETIWSKTKNKEQTMMLEAGAPAVVSEEAVICAYSSGDFASLSVKTGAENWFDVLVSSNVSESGAQISHIATSPVVFDGKVLVATSESQIALTDVETGVRIWEQDFGTINLPVVINNWGFVLSCHHELVCLSMKDGSVKWNVNISQINQKKSAQKNCNTLFTGPIAVNGNILVLDNSGNILSFNPTNGAFIGKMNISRTKITARPPIVVDGTMFILTKRADLYAIR